MEVQKMKSKQTTFASSASSAGKRSDSTSHIPLTISCEIATVSLTRHFGVVLLRRIPVHPSTVSKTTTRFHKFHGRIAGDMMKIGRLVTPAGASLEVSLVDQSPADSLARYRSRPLRRARHGGRLD